MEPSSLSSLSSRRSSPSSVLSGLSLPLRKFTRYTPDSIEVISSAWYSGRTMQRSRAMASTYREGFPFSLPPLRSCGLFDMVSFSLSKLQTCQDVAKLPTPHPSIKSRRFCPERRLFLGSKVLLEIPKLSYGQLKLCLHGSTYMDIVLSTKTHLNSRFEIFVALSPGGPCAKYTERANVMTKYHGATL